MAIIIDIFLNIVGGFLHLLFKTGGIRLITFLGAIWSLLAWYLFKKKRSIIEEELQLLFGSRFDKKQREEITRKSFDNYYRKQVEYLFFGYLDKKTMQRMVTVDGIKNLNKALERKKGTILLLSHFGSFLLPLPFLAYEGYKVNQIAGREVNTTRWQDRFWRWRRKQADMLPVNFIQVGTFLRPVYQRLKKNEIVAVAFDGRDGEKWVPVAFFNRTALFSPGAINLALKTGAVIIPTFIIRENGRHRLILEPPFELKQTGSKKNDLKINIERYTKIFADYSLKHPCHIGFVLQKTRLCSEKGLSGPLFQKVNR